MISIFIFSILFSCAWVLDQNGKRDFYLPEAEGIAEVLDGEIIPIRSAPEVEMVEKQKVKAFGPREYIRIQST
ncbi:hypothetical protein [Cytobacillus massiliigabonensis]|uniref:hypothetical protein n=1 Tax=Cytobacillus massiliigabonensis TaxID=1871011 RepID=UPI001F2F292B|nr:hypothetical protein [Cytobacillus massiliigabonensis]